MEPQLNELADSMMKLDRDVARGLEDLVLHVRVRDGLSRVISSTDAEEYVDLRKYLQIHRSKGRFEWHSGMVIPITTTTTRERRSARRSELRRSDRRIIESTFSISYAAELLLLYKLISCFLLSKQAQNSPTENDLERCLE